MNKFINILFQNEEKRNNFLTSNREWTNPLTTGKIVNHRKTRISILKSLNLNTMKTTMIMFCLAVISWGASAQMEHSKMTEKANGQPSIKVEHSLLTTSIIDNYLALKNALAVDDTKKAASSGKVLFDALGKLSISSFPASKQKELKDILDDATENAEHISVSGGKLDHQREHFEIIGTDIKDLIVILGVDRTLYQIHCPMYNNKKGGNWLNETKEIKNPLLGTKMSNCGSVIQEITYK